MRAFPEIPKSLPLSDGWKLPREDFEFFLIKSKCCRKKKWFVLVWKNKCHLYHFIPMYFVDWTSLRYDWGLPSWDSDKWVFRLSWGRGSPKKSDHALTLLSIFFLDASYWPQRRGDCCGRWLCMTTCSWPDIVICIMPKRWTSSMQVPLQLSPGRQPMCFHRLLPLVLVALLYSRVGRAGKTAI